MPQMSLTSLEANILADVIANRRGKLDSIVSALRRHKQTETPDGRSVIVTHLHEGIVLQHVAAKLRTAQARDKRLLRGRIAKRNVTAPRS